MSLANAVAVSPAARNLVLLGDPQQLDQPLQGTHPPGAEASALGHVLAGDVDDAAGTRPLPGADAAAPPGPVPLHLRGLLRGPAGARRRGSARQDLAGPAPPSTAPGVRFVPVAHEGNSNESPEEADAGRRAGARAGRGGATWTDEHGRSSRCRLGRRAGRRPVQRPGRRDRAGCCRRPASAPSTSSRARRRRSPSTRWRPRAPRRRRAAWSSSTA